MKKNNMMKLMTKLGIEFTSKIRLDRATEKITRFLESEGLPEDVELNEEDIVFLKELGFDLEVSEEEDGQPEPDDYEMTDEEEAAVDAEAEDAEEATEDDEDDEEGAPAKEVPTKKKKAPSTAKKSMNRISAAVEALKVSDGLSEDEYRENANSLYEESGGKNNIKEATYSCNRVINVAVLFDIVKLEDGKITVL